MTAAPSAPPRVGVVIPVLNGGDTLVPLIEALHAQRPRPPDAIVLVDSGSTDGAPARVAGRPGVCLVPVPSFTHGGSRNLGARLCEADVVVFLTQDAMPAGPHWLQDLLAPLADPGVAAVYGRQLPRPDAAPTERFFLQHRFPPESHRKAPPGPDQAIAYEDAIFSDVNSAVRAPVLARHPFDETLIMSEDLKLAVELLRAGHGIAYAAEAAVVHSHHYRLPHLFRRYFDSVVAIREIFAGERGNRASSMGLRYLRAEFPWLLRNHPAYLPRYALELTTKVLATLLARHADRLPLWLLRRASLHPGHWGRRPSAVPPA